MTQCWNQRFCALRSDRWQRCSCGGCCRRPSRRSTRAWRCRCRRPSRRSCWPASNRRARQTSARKSATLQLSSPATSSVTLMFSQDHRFLPCWRLMLWRRTLIIFIVSYLDDDGNNQWPELLKFLFESVNSDNVGLREAALHIFWWAPVHSIPNLSFRPYQCCVSDQTTMFR